MKNSKLVLMTIIGFSAALVAQEVEIETAQDAIAYVEAITVSEDSVVESLQAPVVTEKTDVASDVASEEVVSVQAPVATEESVTTPSYPDRLQTSYNDFLAFSSTTMTQVSQYANENPVITGSAVAAVVVTIAGVSYYAYTQSGNSTK